MFYLDRFTSDYVKITNTSIERSHSFYNQPGFRNGFNLSILHLR